MLHMSGPLFLGLGKDRSQVAVRGPSFVASVVSDCCQAIFALRLDLQKFVRSIRCISQFWSAKPLAPDGRCQEQFLFHTPRGESLRSGLVRRFDLGDGSIIEDEP